MVRGDHRVSIPDVVAAKFPYLKFVPGVVWGEVCTYVIVVSEGRLRLRLNSVRVDQWASVRGRCIVGVRPAR